MKKTQSDFSLERIFRSPGLQNNEILAPLSFFCLKFRTVRGMANLLVSAVSNSCWFYGFAVTTSPYFMGHLTKEGKISPSFFPFFSVFPTFVKCLLTSPRRKKNIPLRVRGKKIIIQKLMHDLQYFWKYLVSVFLKRSLYFPSNFYISFMPLKFHIALNHFINI